ncbi:MAG: YggT family protein [Helicobacteraceae bacterium]|jgi:YggT family protein|nr:YggT family protein [Helicobacteraceae bacterium]
MNALATIIYAVATILGQVITIYIWVAIIAALISWVRPDPYNPVVQILYRLTEPVYALIRRVIRTNFQGFDFAPIILILALQFINLTLVRLLMDFARSLTQNG